MLAYNNLIQVLILFNVVAWKGRGGGGMELFDLSQGVGFRVVPHLGAPTDFDMRISDLLKMEYLMYRSR